MKTVGQILKSHRLKQNLSLDQVALATKIKKTFLKAIEADDFSIFDSYATAYGFIRNYARFLKIDERQTLAVFKRDFGINPLGKITPRELIDNYYSHPNSSRSFNFLIIPGIFLALLVLILTYLFRHYIFPPPLKIYQPKDVQIFTTNRIFVKGKTLPLAKVTINQLFTTPDPNGYFEQPVTLLPGINQIIIKATYKNKYSTKTLEVIYRPPNLTQPQ